ncbi:MAG: molybdopterin-guanine dinucleotide biosynthesis protein MobB, partial [Planctomycetaceae bacterium]|nr:molybdopterin-guanine dinucleotide biosynthesis protein MobB [Planctomycetaceae bacterium]
VKHTHHNHELDTPGKDSFQHRQAGAAAVGILSPQLTALFVPETRAESDEMRYRRFEQAFRDCDLIVVEGDLNTSAPRVEVWRSTVGERPYAVSDSDIRAVVSDEQIRDVNCPIWKRSDVAVVAAEVIQMMQLGDRQ